MQKKALRVKYRSERLALTPQQRMKLDDLLLIQFQKLMPPPLQTVLSFYPIEGKGEINSFLFTDFLAFRNPGLQVCYPRTEVFQNTMLAVVATDESSFALNAWNIPEPTGDTIVEPQQLDAVLVPLLVFDEKGNRVGYGKGFYDRFLAQTRADCIKVGLSYFEPVPRIEDAGNFDVPLSHCITPQQIYVF